MSDTAPSTDLPSTDLPDIRPDPGRVIARLSARIAALESENAQLHDVVGQLLEQRNDTARAAEKAQADARLSCNEVHPQFDVHHPEGHPATEAIQP